MRIEFRLDRALKTAGMTRYRLSKAAGLAYATTSGLYHGDVEGITFETLGRLCTALKCQPGDLFALVPGEPRPRPNAAAVRRAARARRKPKPARRKAAA